MFFKNIGWANQWEVVAVLKTVRANQCCVGSTPTPSANIWEIDAWDANLPRKQVHPEMGDGSSPLSPAKFVLLVTEVTGLSIHPLRVVRASTIRVNV